MHGRASGVLLPMTAYRQSALCKAPRKTHILDGQCAGDPAESGCTTRGAHTRKLQQGTRVSQAPDTTQGPSPSRPPTRRRHLLVVVRAHNMQSLHEESESTIPSLTSHQDPRTIFKQRRSATRAKRRSNRAAGRGAPWQSTMFIIS